MFSRSAQDASVDKSNSDSRNAHLFTYGLKICMFDARNLINKPDDLRSVPNVNNFDAAL